MKITYYDHFAFACITKNGTFVINPAKKDDSLLFSVYTGADRDIELNGNFLTWPGEYEFGDIVIQLFKLPNEKLGSKFVVEGIRMLFLPSLDETLSESDMEVFGDIDFLVIEVEKEDSKFKKMIEEIDPKAIVPVGPFRDKLLTNMGATDVESSDQYIFTSSSLPVDKSIYIKLQAV